MLVESTMVCVQAVSCTLLHHMLLRHTSLTFDLHDKSRPLRRTQAPKSVAKTSMSVLIPASHWPSARTKPPRRSQQNALITSGKIACVLPSQATQQKSCKLPKAVKRAAEMIAPGRIRPFPISAALPVHRWVST